MYDSSGLEVERPRHSAHERSPQERRRQGPEDIGQIKAEDYY